MTYTFKVKFINKPQMTIIGWILLILGNSASPCNSNSGNNIVVKKEKMARLQNIIKNKTATPAKAGSVFINKIISNPIIISA